MNEYFLSEWEKKANINLIHKGRKQIIKKYQPVSLLPICGNCFLKKSTFILSLNI